MPIITPPVITKQRAVADQTVSVEKHLMSLKGSVRCNINQACLRWLGAVFRL
jgi:hypothetical protein